MGLSVKNNEAERLVRELAKRRGIGVTNAIQLAVSNELSKDKMPKKDPDKIMKAIAEIQDQWAALPDGDLADAVSANDVDAWLYDENGLPH